MGAAAHETVEFLDLLPGAPLTDPLVEEPTERTRRWPSVLLALAVVGGLFTAARLMGAPPPVVPAAAAEAPVYGSEVLLPTGFGTPRVLATATATPGDVVWVLGEQGRVARLVDGVVAGTSPGTGYDALAVRPDGRAVFAATGRLAPSVVALDPVTLEPRAEAMALAPVTALASGVGSVWAASAGGVQGWTTDLVGSMRLLRLPPEVTAVRTLAVVGPQLQAVVTTTPATTALLRLTPPGGAPALTSVFAGPVSVVPGAPALVAHLGRQRTVEVVVDPSSPGRAATLGRPLPSDASVWPAVAAGSAAWIGSARSSAVLDCYDAGGQLVGRMAVGDTGRGVAGPVVTTARAVYAVTTTGELARGGHASCGVAPRASTGGRRGD